MLIGNGNPTPLRGGNYVQIFAIRALDIVPQAAQCCPLAGGWSRLIKKLAKKSR